VVLNTYDLPAHDRGREQHVCAQTPTTPSPSHGKPFLPQKARGITSSFLAFREEMLVEINEPGESLHASIAALVIAGENYRQALCTPLPHWGLGDG
jgi:hypothetical protein